MLDGNGCLACTVARRYVEVEGGRNLDLERTPPRADTSPFGSATRLRGLVGTVLFSLVASGVLLAALELEDEDPLVTGAILLLGFQLPALLWLRRALACLEGFGISFKDLRRRSRGAPWRMTPPVPSLVRGAM